VDGGKGSLSILSIKSTLSISSSDKKKTQSGLGVMSRSLTDLNPTSGPYLGLAAQAEQDARLKALRKEQPNEITA
jgi:hypothetical protein